MAGLTARAICALKPAARPYRAFDSGGLYLEVAPSGGRYWRLKYRYARKEKRLAIGVYPAVSLAAARGRRDDARAVLRSGSDPGAVKKLEKLKANFAQGETFESVAREWLAKQKSKQAHSTYIKAVWTFEQLLFPWIGRQPVSKITAAELIGNIAAY